MRLRFAPSPTGFLHIGNARTAIINNLLSQKHNASLVLRIEDTDMERSSKESEDSIMKDLSWLGIQWTEGPDCGGDYGPYRQSERFDIYKEYTEKLLSEGKAYYCYCSAEETEQMRKEAQASGRNETYNGNCRNLTSEQKTRLEQEGRKPTIRFHVNPDKDISFNDTIKGSVSFNSSNIGGDFIIVRSDGIPVYNYIVVIDDALMKISHVIRGEDHLSNTPKQLLISQALGFDTPEYAHLPLVMGEDKKKLSKRHGITSVNLYREEGYLPEALVNYISMLGWASDDEEEILPISEIIKQFELTKIGASSAVFDFKKLRWMNGNYIRSTEGAKLLKLMYPFLSKEYDLKSYSDGWLIAVITFLTPYCELLSDINTQISHFLSDDIVYTDEIKELLLSEDGWKIVETTKELFDSKLTSDNFYSDYINLVKEKTGAKGKNLFMPCRSIMTGSIHGPDLAETMKLYDFGKCKIRANTAYNLKQV
ncbi:MAG: glutamate--tRNA ligase [Spirochaetes bacterium]|jgi:nondiscriminating glutamyl-tRNA synthetase|nr:glutamate--tRNA ligase [Spirochaetota bacterium]